MAYVDSLRTHLVDELADLMDAERQLTKALPKMADSAAAGPLKTAFRKHLKETEGHLARLNRAFAQLGESPASKTCEGMQGLLEEGETSMNDSPEGPLRDAVMITGAQKVEHYEMASYGTARTYAEVLGEHAVARLLDQTLKEEKAADMKLTQIAEGSVNEAAAEQLAGDNGDEGIVERTTRSATRTVGTARRSARSAAGGLSKMAKRAAEAVGLSERRSSSRGRTAKRSRTRSAARKR